MIPFAAFSRAKTNQFALLLSTYQAKRGSTEKNMSCRKYNSQLLDSSSSLGQMSSISQQQEPAKKGGIFGFKKKSKPPAPRGMMPSITEQSGQCPYEHLPFS